MSPYVRQLALGPMQNFVYLVGHPYRPETAVIDPAWDVSAILAAAAADGRQVTHALLTHRHADHTNGVGELVARAGVTVHVHAAEADRLPPEIGPHTIRRFSAGDTLDVGGLAIQVIHTPGHTPGSTCFHSASTPPVLFTGDTLFVNACGRADLEGGNAPELHDSLTRVLAGLPDETVVYPGHDYGDVKVSSLGRERARNPYLRFPDREAFVAYRLRPRG